VVFAGLSLKIRRAAPQTKRPSSEAILEPEGRSIIMQRKTIWKAVRVLVVLVVAAAISAALVWFKPHPAREERKEPAPLVEVVPATSADRTMRVEGFGTVVAREVLDLASEVKGRVVAVHENFKEGGFVRQGETMVQIDPRTYELEARRLNVRLRQQQAESAVVRRQKKNLKASIDIAKSDADLSNAEFERLQRLKQRKVVAQSTLDKTRQQYLASVQRLQELENQLALTDPQLDQVLTGMDMTRVLLEQARLDLERTRILAPYDGWVLEKTVETGQFVAVGMPLGRIYRSGGLDVAVRIPAGEFIWIQDDIRGGNMPEAVISAAAGSGVRLNRTGRVARVKARVDEKTRTIPLVVEILPAADIEAGAFELKPGMFVRVQIRGKTFSGVFQLPRYQVREGDVVYVVEDGRLRIRPVRVIRYFKDVVYVDRGLSDGDRIIRTPLATAVDGMPVRVK